MGFVPDRQAPRKCELRNTTCPQVLCGVATDLPKQMWMWLHYIGLMKKEHAVKL